MKVKDLKELLSMLDPELPVLISAYEGGLTNTTVLYTSPVVLNFSDKGWTGEHREIGYFSKRERKGLKTEVCLVIGEQYPDDESMSEVIYDAK